MLSKLCDHACDALSLDQALYSAYSYSYSSFIWIVAVMSAGISYHIIDSNA